MAASSGGVLLDLLDDLPDLPSRAKQSPVIRSNPNGKRTARLNLTLQARKHEQPQHQLQQQPQPQPQPQPQHQPRLQHEQLQQLQLQLQQQQLQPQLQPHLHPDPQLQPQPQPQPQPHLHPHHQLQHTQQQLAVLLAENQLLHERQLRHEKRRRKRSRSRKRAAQQQQQQQVQQQQQQQQQHQQQQQQSEGYQQTPPPPSLVENSGDSRESRSLPATGNEAAHIHGDQHQPPPPPTTNTNSKMSASMDASSKQTVKSTPSKGTNRDNSTDALKCSNNEIQSETIKTKSNSTGPGHIEGVGGCVSPDAEYVSIQTVRVSPRRPKRKQELNLRPNKDIPPRTPTAATRVHEDVAVRSCPSHASVSTVITDLTNSPSPGMSDDGWAVSKLSSEGVSRRVPADDTNGIMSSPKQNLSLREVVMIQSKVKSEIEHKKQTLTPPQLSPQSPSCIAPPLNEPVWEQQQRQYPDPISSPIFTTPPKQGRSPTPTSTKEGSPLNQLLHDAIKRADRNDELVRLALNRVNDLRASTRRSRSPRGRGTGTGNIDIYY